MCIRKLPKRYHVGIIFGTAVINGNSTIIFFVKGGTCRSGMAVFSIIGLIH
uniref:Uncharacterized protein LOC105107905 isoform X1 n=1 Tax=Rhizophora mucronata TaxID=61149 RepID=A0A2P2QVM5_RHIMU